MVEVLKSNFEDMLPAIQKAIQASSFIAIDTEFTGLDMKSSSQPSLFDSLEERYRKMKCSASNFVISQLGMTMFTKNKEKNSYYAQTFVFYLRPHQCGSIDRRFCFQASCIDFLTAYDFDFNKFLIEGLPYLNENELELVKEEISNGTFCLPHLHNIGEQTRRYDTVSNWLNTAKLGDEMTLPVEIVGHEYFQLYALRWKFPAAWVYIKENKVYIKKVSAETREDLQKTVAKEEKQLLDFYIGFGHVFKTLKESKKIIIGHNLLMDLFLIYNSFHRYLPDSFHEFKKNVMDLFHSVYDTKHMWLNVRKFYDIGRISRKSGLYELFETLRKPSDNLATMFFPAVEYLNCESYESMSFPHNAGYDSFLSGWVFLRLCHILAIKRTKDIVQIVPQSLRQHLNAVKPFENKVNISRARVFYIDLSGKDEVIHRPHFLYVKIKNPESIRSMVEVDQRLRFYGHVEVKQIGKFEFLVAVASFACAEDILGALSNDETLHVDRYSPLKHWRPARIGLWSICLASSALSVFLMFKFVR